MKTHRPRIALACFLVALAHLFAVFPRGAQAAPPALMSYQGFLVDAVGNPLAMGNPTNYPVIFRIFGASSGGTTLWSEQQIVTVDKGNFSVQLGQGTRVGSEPGEQPISTVFTGANSAERYLELTVTINGSPVILLPRLRLLPSPYAFLSARANGLVSDTGQELVTTSGSSLTVVAPVSVTGSFSVTGSGTISGNGSGITGLVASQIPNIDASKVTTGVLNTNQIPVIPSTKIPTDLGTRTFSGNVGIGTTSPTNKLHVVGNASVNGSLDVAGNIRMGSSSGESLVTAMSPTGLRIVSGIVPAVFATNTTVISGNGYRVTQAWGSIGGFPIPTGRYTLIFDPPFTTQPVVTVTAINSLSSTALNTADFRLRTGFNTNDVRTFDHDSSTDSFDSSPSSFSFIAIGR